MLIVVAGTIGRSVTGGQSWANLNYLLGLRALGHEVYYLEDVGDWSSTYDWDSGEQTESLDHPAQYIDSELRPFEFGEKWVYRAGTQTRGLSLEDLRELCRSADLLLIRGVPMIAWRKEYTWPRRRVFVDVDPGFTQITFSRGDRAHCETIEHCETVFSYGQNLAEPDCPIPPAGRNWQPTLPPLFLPEWPELEPDVGGDFTSIMRWRGVKDREYRGVIYGQKDREFPRFQDLPGQTDQRFRLALVGGGQTQCRRHGWDVIDGHEVSASGDDYRRFIQASRAEFGVAKHGYVLGRVGWFSDRSICYLASGRPVLVQDTGIKWLPDAGVVTFGNLEEAKAGVQEINDEYESHCAAARRFVESRFASDRVLDELLERSMQKESWI